MNKPDNNAPHPIEVTLEAGQKYAWCRCGRSQTQPFCDGAHKGTEHTPLVFTAEKSGLSWLCVCKQTKTPPFCDGTHSSLKDGDS